MAGVDDVGRQDRISLAGWRYRTLGDERVIRVPDVELTLVSPKALKFNWISVGEGFSRLRLRVHEPSDRQAWEYFYSRWIRFLARASDGSWVVCNSPYRVAEGGFLEPLAQVAKGALVGSSDFHLSYWDAQRILEGHPWVFDSLASTAIRPETRELHRVAPEPAPARLPALPPKIASRENKVRQGRKDALNRHLLARAKARCPDQADYQREVERMDKNLRTVRDCLENRPMPSPLEVTAVQGRRVGDPDALIRRDASLLLDVPDIFEVLNDPWPIEGLNVSPLFRVRMPVPLLAADGRFSEVIEAESRDRANNVPPIEATFESALQLLVDSAELPSPWNPEFFTRLLEIALVSDQVLEDIGVELDERYSLTRGDQETARAEFQQALATGFCKRIEHRMTGFLKLKTASATLPETGCQRCGAERDQRGEGGLLLKLCRACDVEHPGEDPPETQSRRRKARHVIRRHGRT